MILNSGIYVVFLCIICFISYVLPAKIRYIWLLAASVGFYIYDSYDSTGFTQNLPAFGLLCVAVLASYLCARLMQASKKISVRRLFLAISLLCCLGLLAACKYFDFFATETENILRLFGGQVSVVRLNLVLPLGISYYTLQAVSYSIDVYTKSQRAEKNFPLYALYVSFFPSMVTGPINRAGAMLPQYASPPTFQYNQVAGGLFRVLWGLFKKMVIADSIAPFTSAVFTDPGSYKGPHIILAALLFAYQLYADFGGCCDIAIGSAKMLGFDFMENFNRPYAAKTFSGLWQRWHMSLTSFFRDYVFTPLVWSRWTEKLPVIGKRITKPPAISSLIIIFLLSGLWHGANWYYILWGLLNGVIMALSTLYGKRKEKLIRKIPFYGASHFRGFVQRILVFLMFAGCLAVFAFAMYQTPVQDWFSEIYRGWRALFAGHLVDTFRTSGLQLYVVVMLAVSILGVEIIEMFAVSDKTNISLWIRKQQWFIRWPLYYLLILALMAFGVFGQSGFIYQQY